jgi:hypothetical protein
MPVRFYRTEAGGAPVLDWLRGLDKDDRRAIGLDLMRVQFGWPIGRPLVRSLKAGLWEVRSSLPSQRIARLILCFHLPDARRAPRVHQENAENACQPVAEAASLRSRFCNSLTLQNRARQQAVRMYFYHRLLRMTWPWRNGE